jgi:hypothetical protein
MRLTAYDEHNIVISRELEQLKHEDAFFCSGTLPPLNQDLELMITYCRLSEAEHGWNYTRQQLDATRAEVDERTHAIIHLDHANEQ